MNRADDWPVLRTYDQDHLARIALPLGGIGTGTVSLGGRGDLRHWEVMNRPAKGYVPQSRFGGRPFFAVRVQPSAQVPTDDPVVRVLEGPLELFEYEGASGSTTTNHGLPRFRRCSFSAAYPLGQVFLSDPAVPVRVRLQAFNPLVPGDAEASGLPLAVLRYTVTNRTARPLTVSLCGSLPNFVGHDGSEGRCVGNRNRTRTEGGLTGVLLDSTGVERTAAQWGSLALATTARGQVSCRTAWLAAGWGTSLLDWWDDLSADGSLDEREPGGEEQPTASVAVRFRLAPRGSRSVTFLLAWHFPNRLTWNPKGNSEDLIGNWYAGQHADAWAVLTAVAPRLRKLEERTVRFVRAFCDADLPAEVKEAALFNLSTLRSQTCFRTPDGRLFGWEGCSDRSGCCMGSCTHVWNYEQSTAFLFGDLARTMREVEFHHALRDDGMMSFRVDLPLSRAQAFGKAAADGQLGCVVKAYRDWQLSGDPALLASLYPGVRKALEFCWIPGGWDGDSDGVMEGCQHNTMDVEYYGPNPQMGIWYLAALRAGEEMAHHAGDEAFADTCRALFERGSHWLDEHLFNGEYYEHEVRPPADPAAVAEGLRVGAGAANPSDPDYQLGPGCLVDQLVGQLLSHVSGLGYLVDPGHVRRTLASIWRYNRRDGLSGHFNCLRSFALGEEAALLMASYPKGRPANPFPYFTEVMTGFEYAAAVGMLYEGQVEEGLQAIRDIRERYDGRKRNPFDEAECGHHYARAMVAWAGLLALTGFHWSGVEKRLTLAGRPMAAFWSNGYAWGTCRVASRRGTMEVALTVVEGELELAEFVLTGYGVHRPSRRWKLTAGRTRTFTVTPTSGRSAAVRGRRRRTVP
ncbi:MAG: GH116 family glycosyl-hydrolase [Candidatus Latescibacterota bacterium]|jgi:uncharacterized protein (DUF608 family)